MNSDFLAFITRLKVKVLVHATEDAELVKAKLAGWLDLQAPLEEFDGASIERLQGEYGNPIVLITVQSAKKRQVKAVVESLSAQLPALEKKTLRAQLERRLDRRNVFHLRVDKDALVQGRVRLSRGNDVVLELKFRKMFKGTKFKDSAEFVFQELELI